MFQLGMEQRRAEAGILLALGFEPRRVRALFLGEGLLLSAIGAGAGAAGGLLYARALLAGLSTVWRDAVGGAVLSFHATPASVATGWAASVVVSGLAIGLTLRKLGRQPVHELLAGLAPSEGSVGGGPPSRRLANAVTITCGLAGAGLALGAVLRGETANPGIFFGAGALCLAGALGGLAWMLARLDRPGASAAGLMSLAELASRGMARRRTRSLAAAALLACGSFLVVAVGAQRLDVRSRPGERASGTGGFALLGRATLPVVKDLNTREGREAYGLSESVMKDVSVVAFRVREGDEASCLSLNRARAPRILGVNPEALASRGAFRFARTIPAVAPGREWLLLRRDPADTAIPAIGDEASILWALGKKLGDTLEIQDEAGRPVKLRLAGAAANSILQGSLVIAEEEFLRLFPGQSGYQEFFIDAPERRVAGVSAELSRQLEDAGLEVVPAARRLAQFNAVQNTYLSTFEVLGGLGLLLGSAGLGAVVLRNVFERRDELALMVALGFEKGLVRNLVLVEHAVLLVLGLAAGLLAAVVAVAPGFFGPAAQWPLQSLGLTLGSVLAAGLFWTWAAAWQALRGPLLDALRNE